MQKTQKLTIFDRFFNNIAVFWQKHTNFLPKWSEITEKDVEKTVERLQTAIDLNLQECSQRQMLANQRITLLENQILQERRAIEANAERASYLQELKAGISRL